MELPGNKLLLCAAVTTAALALPTGAAAESVVPPENSAATQYTEAIPTGGGQQDTERGGHGKRRSPSSVLGSKKAKKLDAQGPQGHAAAQIAAETAPPSVQSTSEAEPAPAPHGRISHGEAEAQTGKTGGKAPPHEPSPQGTVARQPRLESSGGSSGVDEILGQATGSSSDGELGLLLPLLLLGTLIWALAYGLRRKRQAI